MFLLGDRGIMTIGYDTDTDTDADTRRTSRRPVGSQPRPPRRPEPI
jgi:hypothetical protein